MATKQLTDIAGVYGSGICCGIKQDKLDLAYLYLPDCSGSAAVFTTNHFRAPCVAYAEQAFAHNLVKAVVINSGNANAATGVAGYRDAERTASIAANALSLTAGEVAVASTGIIGVPLPMERIASGLATLLAKPKQKNGPLVSQAILTTDLVAKEVFLSRTIAGVSLSIAGTTKGSGMIAPSMATMLGFLVTDISLNSAECRELLQQSVQRTFNMISVDTDTSTNDTVMLFSTGAQKLNLKDSATKREVAALLEEACRELAVKIVRDGEGATKLVSVTVKQAASEQDAKRIARSIADSPLVKTAIHGADPNWGRVVMAIGKTAEIAITPEKVEVFFGPTKVFANAQPVPFSRQALHDYLTGSEIEILVDMQIGSHTATAWGCDLSHAYVDINVAYS